jgi:UDP-N-acetylmuramoyl-L-alanyl-D-glutamate--2,6-diaminopimelate ligase
MTLSQLLDGIPVTKLLQMAYGKMLQSEDINIRRVTYDSRTVEPGDVFVAIKGLTYDGHRFISDAIHRGARAVVMEEDQSVPDSFFAHNDVVKIVVMNSRRALAHMAANYYSWPSKILRLVGVTGTNGKTTTTHLLKSIFEAADERVGLIGTIEYKIAGDVIPAVQTTPESLELNALLDSMVKRGCHSAVMEVSSHALALDRVYGLEYQLALFTNLTQDHLDFHKTIDEYFRAKKLLFDGLGERSIAVTNLDDEHGLPIVASTKAKRVTYGLMNAADVTAGNVRVGMDGISLDVTYGSSSVNISSPLTGRFNLYNVLSATASALALGIHADAIQNGIERVKSVRGRFERIVSPSGWIAIIDYAHTPDALRKTLEAIREMIPGGGTGRVITIFGCGGDRDREKRPQMGRIASELSDLTIVTSDNPRREDPDRIIDEILQGVQKNAEVKRIENRREAIQTGLRLARSGDIVLIAGKGHEIYQVLGDRRIHFDDREIVEEHIQSG